MSGSGSHGAMVVIAIYVGFIGFKSVQMGVTCKWGWKRLCATGQPPGEKARKLFSGGGRVDAAFVVC